ALYVTLAGIGGTMKDRHLPTPGFSEVKDRAIDKDQIAAGYRKVLRSDMVQAAVGADCCGPFAQAEAAFLLDADAQRHSAVWTDGVDVLTEKRRGHAPGRHAVGFRADGAKEEEHNQNETSGLDEPAAADRGSVSCGQMKNHVCSVSKTAKNASCGISTCPTCF